MSEYEPDQLRLYLLSTHYRIDGDYRDGDLAALTDRYHRLKAAAGSEGGDPKTQVSALPPAVVERLDDDFDTPHALELLDASAVRILAGTAAEGERLALRSACAALGFAFAGARGPANGDLTP